MIDAIDVGDDAPRDGFRVRVADFEGPFDLLLSLIGRHQMEVTELALHLVTDEFIAYIRDQDGSWSLDEATEFLVIAATLLDLKAARLLPSGEVEDEDDLAVLEARDLLFARLLQYRAFKEVAADFAHAMLRESGRHARQASLEEPFASLLPEVLLLGPEAFSLIAAKALAPRPVPVVGVEHLHVPKVSVREQGIVVGQRIRRLGTTTFRHLIQDAESRLVVVARFLALLELYRDGDVTFDQVTPLGDLHVRWCGSEEMRAEFDEFEGATDV
jgi:segregation and condensation protein A